MKVNIVHNVRNITEHVSNLINPSIWVNFSYMPFSTIGLQGSAGRLTGTRSHDRATSEPQLTVIEPHSMT